MDIPQSLLDLAKKTEKGEYPLHDLRSSFKKYPDEIVLEICSGIINNYREHKNFFMAVMLSEEIENRNGIKCLGAVRALEELVRNLNVKLSLRRLLEANIELLEIEANDDFENIRCRCEVYVKYAMLPESCRGIEIISKEDPSEGFADYVIQKVACIHCARKWNVEIGGYSHSGIDVQWDFIVDE